MKTVFSFLCRVLAGAAIAGSLHFAASAASIPAADEKDVRAVVQAQLDAFAADDAKRAFSYAAPNIKELMGTPEKFMAMVRGSYPVVYRPASIAFLKPESSDEGVVQRVQMTDSAGESWMAAYLLQQQKDRSWRISACVVARHTGRSV